MILWQAYHSCKESRDHGPATCCHWRQPSPLLCNCACWQGVFVGWVLLGCLRMHMALRSLLHWVGITSIVHALALCLSLGAFVRMCASRRACVHKGHEPIVGCSARSVHGNVNVGICNQEGIWDFGPKLFILRSCLCLLLASCHHGKGVLGKLLIAG